MCIANVTIDVDRVCCQRHIFTAFIVPDILILMSYIFGVYLFSTAETEYISKLAEEVDNCAFAMHQDNIVAFLNWQVFIKTAHATGGKFPKKLIATIG